MQHLTYYDKEDLLKRIEGVRRLAVERRWTACTALDYLIDNLYTKKLDYVDSKELKKVADSMKELSEKLRGF